MLISTNSGLYSKRMGQSRYLMTDAMDFFARMGFDAVDVNFAATIYDGEEKHEPVLDGDWKANVAAVRERILANGLAVSHTHLPFYDYEMADKDMLNYNNQMTFRSIEASALVGAKLAVIHPQRQQGTAYFRPTLVKRTVELLTPFREAAEKAGVTLCVENMNTTTPEQLLEIANGLNCAVCWDCGHANLAGVNQHDAIVYLGNKVQVLHLHDNYGAKDDHALPFLGNVDWAGLLKGLREVGYPGTFNYEVSAPALPHDLREEHARYMVKAARCLLDTYYKD